MDKTTLVFIMGGLIILFIILVAVYVGAQGSKKAVSVHSKPVVTFEVMCTVINRSSTSNEELNDAVDTILKHYSQITDFDVYGALLEKLCMHPNTDSKVILRFQKALITANPKYKEKIAKSLKLGLAGRK